MATSERARARDRSRGKRVTPPTVADLMRREFITVPAEERLVEAQRTMRLARLRHLLVVENGALVGLLSYRDVQDTLLERAARESAEAWLDALRAVAVREAMVVGPYYVRPETPANEAARRMLSLHLGCLPVCEPDADTGLRLVGLLAESDLLRAAWR